MATSPAEGLVLTEIEADKDYMKNGKKQTASFWCNLDKNEEW